MSGGTFLGFLVTATIFTAIGFFLGMIFQENQQLREKESERYFKNRLE